MRTRTAGTVADVVVAVVAQRDIHHSAPCKVLHVGRVVLNGESVFNPEHYGMPPGALVSVQVGRRLSDAKVRNVLVYNAFERVEDVVGVCFRTVKPRRHLVGKRLAGLGLRQIGGHYDRILSPFVHLVKVNKYARVAPVEVYALRKEHRRVAMRVQSERPPVNGLGLSELCRPADKPLEQGQPFITKPFGMPLHAHDRLELAALNGLYHAVGRHRRHRETPSAGTHSLMMERVDGQRFHII